MAKIFARIKRPSLRWGLIFGIIAGIIVILYNVVALFVTDPTAQSLLGYIPEILFIVLGFYAGMRASRETGKWTSGLAAGIWVGVIAALIVNIIPVVSTLVNLDNILASQRLYIKAHEAQLNNLNPADYTISDVIVTMLEGVLYLILLAAFFTTIGGALGGFTGRRRALATSQSTASEESLFTAPAGEKTPEYDETGKEGQPAEITDEAAR